MQHICVQMNRKKDCVFTDRNGQFAFYCHKSEMNRVKRVMLLQINCMLL